MEIISEKNKIMFQLSGEKPLMPYIEISIECTSNDFLAKIISVLSVLSELDRDNWPKDDFFERELPKWFVDTTMKNSFEVIDAMPELYLWHFGSWLDAMKDRNWRWESSLKTETGFKFYIEVFEFQFIIEPLEYLIRCTKDVNKYSIKEISANPLINQEWIFVNYKWIYRNI